MEINTFHNTAIAEMKFNPVFRAAHESRCRYILLKGGAGSGKSYDTAQFLIKRLLSEPGRNLLCVRKIFESNRLSTMAELAGVLARTGLSRYFTVTKSPMEICCANGNRIEFAGCCDDAQRDKLKSIQMPFGKLSDVWIEEATELTPADFHIIDDRLRGELPEGLFYDFESDSPMVFLKQEEQQRFQYIGEDYLTGRLFTNSAVLRNRLIYYKDEIPYGELRIAQKAVLGEVDFVDGLNLIQRYRCEMELNEIDEGFEQDNGKR